LGRSFLRLSRSPSPLSQLPSKFANLAETVASIHSVSPINLAHAARSVISTLLATKGNTMKRSRWGKACALAAGLGLLTSGAAWGQYPPIDPSRIVVIREAGKPERRCFIEQAYSTADGKVMYYVRDMTTGESLRVVDSRTHKNSEEPIVGTAIPKPSDASMLKALESSPFATNNTRSPTTAELAGAPSNNPASANSQKLTAPVKAIAKSDSPVQVQLDQLKDGISPSEREMAAMTLASSNANTMPEVVKAIMESAKNDPAATVRTCCVRCLYRVSSEIPNVIPVIKSLQADPNEEVSQTARKAMQEIGKRDPSQPNR
jgi:hypothetical protein